MARPDAFGMETTRLPLLLGERHSTTLCTCERWGYWEICSRSDWVHCAVVNSRDRFSPKSVTCGRSYRFAMDGPFGFSTLGAGGSVTVSFVGLAAFAVATYEVAGAGGAGAGVAAGVAAGVVGGVCSRSLPLANRPRLRLPLRDCGRVGAPVDEDRLVPADGPGAGAGVGVIARATDCARDGAAEVSTAIGV